MVDRTAMDSDTKDLTVEGPRPKSHKPNDEFPDGGLKAWLVVLGAFFGLFVSFGWTNCAKTFRILLSRMEDPSH